MTSLPSMRAIQAFVLAGRMGSFLEAAVRLQLTPSAVSHQIRLMEEDLGEKLFHRIGRSVSLTEAGERYHRDLAEALSMIEQATSEVSRRNSVDVLSVGCAPSLASLWLMPRLPMFEVLHPSIEVRLLSSSDLSKLTDGSVDVDICYCSAPRLGSIASEDFPLETIVVACSPGIASSDKSIVKPSDLIGHTLIRSEHTPYSWQQWAKDHNLQIDLTRGPRFRDAFMSIAAAVEGRGVCLESFRLLEREIDKGNLVLPFGMTGPNLRCHSLTYVRSRLRSHKISAFRSWLERLWFDENEAVEIEARRRAG
ncbi:LysR substrate-binding domain-containing protein [Mesorhizobium sp.]|uniref:LysR substrate-binding domain-containing protein n=1 Tax=Mesorhizobium sp. TaxID=1871066 RepID=UPI000FE89DDB|nr:LysR substrate-binding domain-containing protein [Mesorhizobium sp.]RWG04170.1 MAG: LysR family transcriptional regulator [Mesorhizobium sp.]RWH01167.1 MAG: LysR family transcriptional regulator [Mesorhizobium sp.]RWI16617.1 MAG: LysR family transcriptional regulator [Mesorhizobium sp.]RWN07685.1 MAG: LysR family transcriptional regulator [Mesorhizobium sp.]RWN12397.1 MAG: LysR family transcriptional regulator [Mesorhizobium sp.]